MRLKSFTAPDISQAMAMIRAELGKDAIIVSTQMEAANGSVHVTAALERDGGGHTPATGETAAGEIEAGDMDTLDIVHETLMYHHTPAQLLERLVGLALNFGAEDSVLALAAALDAEIGFAPLNHSPGAKPWLLVGPPGGGRTVCAVKLAARALLCDQTATLITTDVARTGAVDQIKGYAKLLKLGLDVAEGPPGLAEIIASRGGDGVTVIDTTGVNPFLEDDLETLSQLAEAAGAEPILVMAAGGDASDAAEIAEAFSQLGCQRLIVTRTDMAHRLGGILAIADTTGIRLGNISCGPHIGDGLNPINPVALARLLIARPQHTSSTLLNSEAAA